jgi:hypothetical protein
MNLKNKKMTTSDVLINCNINDRLKAELSGGKFLWILTEKYEEDGKIIAIATPDKTNPESFELWSIGENNYSLIKGLKKVI